ncbi:MAG: endonuclease/exonuclease/phosphatase family protein [Bryobacterales bacterium]|nr:endonuclease/exonuclease/phosphatase family protein [Bryobacterales bacterium]
MISQTDYSVDQLHDLIRKRLAPAFPQFRQCRSSEELHDHPVYRQLAEEIRMALETPQCGDYRRGEAAAKERYRFAAWNIERGTQLQGQLDALRHDPFLRDADVLLLIETDVGMVRSGNADVARTMARELGMCYAFVPCYLSLVKGSGVERDTPGENDLGLHGNAILSRYPLREVRGIGLENGIDKIASREQRLGRQTTIAGVVDFPGRPMAAAAVHLCAQSSQRHRMEQMRSILDTMPADLPAVLGGDWNTSTYNSSRAFHAICGFWLRVFMGVDYVIRNHYLYPDNLFERELFRLLEARGYNYRDANLAGRHTVLYDMRDPRAAGSLGEWVPGWCFPFIHWSLRNHDGRCPLKLDWFAVRGVKAENPVILHEKRDGSHVPLSDHDAVGADIR